MATTEEHLAASVVLDTEFHSCSFWSFQVKGNESDARLDLTVWLLQDVLIFAVFGVFSGS